MKGEEQEKDTRFTDDQKLVQKDGAQGTLYRRDSCRSWLVCLCVVLSNALLFGSIQSFGVIFPVLLDEFREGKAKTALVGSIALAMIMTFSPISARLIKCFGPRWVTILGGLVSSLGLFTSSYTRGISLLYLTYSFILGIGISLAHLSNYCIVPLYFKKWIGLAIGLMHAGTGSAYFVSLVVEALINHMGWRQAFQVMSGILLIVCLCGTVFSIDVESDSRQIKKKRTMVIYERTPRKNSRNFRLIIFFLFSLLFAFGNSIPVIHLGRHAQDSGFHHIAYLYVGFGVASIIGRLASGKCSDINLDPCLLLFLVAIVAGISTILFPFANTFTNLLVCFCVNGVCEGFYATLTTVFIYRNTIPEQATKWMSGFLFVISFGYALGPPFAGYIADQMASYVPVFYTSGSVTVTSSFIILALTRCVGRQCEQSENIEGHIELLYEEKIVIAEKLTVL